MPLPRQETTRLRSEDAARCLAIFRSDREVSDYPMDVFPSGNPSFSDSVVIEQSGFPGFDVTHSVRWDSSNAVQLFRFPVPQFVPSIRWHLKLPPEHAKILL